MKYRRSLASSRVRQKGSVLAALVACLAASLLTACTDDRPVDQPEILYGEEPLDYPLDLFDQGEEGEALIRVLVDERGAVDSVEVAESSGHVGLDHAALESLRATRFTPARRGDDRVRAWVTVPVRFSTRPRPDTGPVS